jgi:hypothetical protein
MMGIAIVVFLAALVGLVRPYLKNWSRKNFAALAVGAFVMMMIVVPKDQSQPTDASSAASDTIASGKTNTDTPATTASVAANSSKWEYSENRDQMRGTVSRYAVLKSENVVDLDFPYGEQSGTITIRRNKESGLNIMFSVGEGQILCRSFAPSNISIKFDDGPVRKMRCTSSDDGSSETAFFTNEAPVLAGLRKAKRTIIEADFYQRGGQQFTFDTAGLKWE